MSVQRHSLAERGDDVYETPAVAVHALLRVEQIPNRVWEPACGPGSIVRELRAAGHIVRASDLIDYGCPDSEKRIDFLMERSGGDAEAIVTNPPFKLAAHFVEHGLTVVPTVIMLLRLGFLESDRRSEILDRGRLARVHLFRERLPMMHRRGWDGPKATSQVPYAWFVWNRDHHGPTTIDRVSWRYDPIDDINKSVALGFRVIRERVRGGGKAWEP
jgi:hypothetical protein